MARAARGQRRGAAANRASRAAHGSSPTIAPARLTRLIHDSPLRIVLAATGGGASALSQLLVVPGGSRTVLEGTVPYASAALRSFLGAAPEHYCCEATARAMAMAAFQRALSLAAAEGLDTAASAATLAGIGCTASLATGRPKLGAHRVHLAAQTATSTCVLSLELTKEHRRRAGEEKIVGQLLLNLIAASAGLQQRLDVPLLPTEQVVAREIQAPAEWTKLLLGEQSAVRYGRAADSNGRRAIFPGAFHPRHDGHRRLAELAAQRLGLPVEHEISILNVDKPPLDFLEMDERRRQFSARDTLWFTRAPRFEQKAELFPQATFLVGADTIVRVGDPRYYGGDGVRDQAVANLAHHGARFLVFGRLMEGRFRCLSDLSLPRALRALCDEIPATDFREDVSSTALRHTAQE